MSTGGDSRAVKGRTDASFQHHWMEFGHTNGFTVSPKLGELH